MHSQGTARRRARVSRGVNVRGNGVIALRYALASACIGVAILLHVSPVGPLFHPMGLFILGVVAAAWFGGPGPGVFAAFLSAIALPHLIAVTYPLSMAYPLLAGFFDLPRFITLGLTGMAVGWGTGSYRRAEAALRERGRLLSKARDELETAVAERTAHLSASEEALRRSEERFALALAASSDGIWDWDLVADQQFFSERVQRIFGLEPGPTVRPRSEWDALREFHPEDGPRRLAAVERHLAGETPVYEGEWRVRPMGGGEYHWIHTRGLCVRDAAGRPIRMVGAVTDIDERKRIEAALRQSEERYSLALEATEEGHFDVNLDTEELFTSERLNEIYGFAPGTRFPKRNEYLKQFSFHGNDAETYHAAVRAAEAKGGPERYEFEYRIRRPSGEVRWLRTRGKVTRDAEGRARRRTGVVADITEARLAEQALRTSEERYALAMEAAGDGHTDWNLVTGEFYISPRLLRILGYAPGTTFADRADWVRRFPFHPEDRPRWEAAVADHFAGREAKFRMDLRIVVSGETRWVAFTFIASRDASGKPVRWTGSIADINDAKLAEEALRESQERYALAVAGSDDGVWDCDFAARRVFVSARARELAGMPPGPEMVPIDDWFAMLPVHPEDVPRGTAAMQAHLAGKTPAYEGEFRLRQPDGVYRWRRLHGLCLRDANGNPHRMAGSISDIDARKRAEAALRLSEGRYALALEAAAEGHFDTDLETGEIFVSARLNEIYGFPRHAEAANRVEFLNQIPFHPDDRHFLAEIIRADWKDRTRDVYEFECRIVPRPGEIRWIHTRGKVIRDAEGRPRRRVGVVVDITERKLAEEARRLSEARYALAMEVAEEGHFDWNVQTDEIFASAQALRVIGVPQDVECRTRGEVMAHVRYHPDDWPRISAQWREALAGRATEHEFEYRILRGEEPRSIRGRWKVFRDESGAALRVIGIVADITARKLAEEALRLSEERYAYAMEAAQDAHWDWIVGTDKYYTSPRVVDVFGLPPGTTFTSRLDYLAKTPLVKEDLDVWLRAARELLAGTGSRLSMELRAIINGEVRWIQHNGLCVRDASGRAVRWCGSVRDVTERRRAEEALRLSEERYALAMEVSEEGHFDWNVQTDEIFASAHLVKLLDLPPDLEYRTRTDMVSRMPFCPGESERVAQMARDVLAGSALQHEFEYRLRHREAEEPRWIHARWKIFRDANGAPQRVIGVVSDITQREQAVETLRVSELRFRTLVELNSNGFWVQDENLRYTSSPLTSDVAGYDKHGMDGKTRWELSGDPTPLSTTWAEHQADLAARRPFRDFEYRRLRPDGKVGYYSASGAPIFDHEGRFRGYYGVASDITERKRAEEELRSRQEMLELAQKSARAIAFEWKIGEGEGENRWSPDLEVMYGFAPGTYDGTFETWQKCVHLEDWPAVKEAVRHAHRTGEVAAEYRVVHPDGSAHWLQARGRMLFDAVGNATRMVGFMQDITQRKQAEEELRKMEQELRRAQRLEAIGTLAGGIAHDFNNILGAILGYGEMAMRDAKQGTRLHRDLDSIIAAGERGRALVDRILAFSRSGVGERVPVHVEAVVREALDQVAASLPENVTIRPRLRAGPAAMLGDSTQVHQVVMNLASNAVQAMPQGGTLGVALETARFDAARPATVGAIVPGDYIVLRMSDTGTGIPDDVLERMFDPFFTTKEVGVGTGLGLSLVHGIVTSVGGAIDVATERGKGTAFTVSLRRAGDATAGPSDEDPPLPRGEGQRVLVVDDEEPLVRLTTETLEELGYVALGFTSSAAALEAIRADPQRFDAMITDERMPGMTGSALIRQVRDIRDGIPIVLMTGFVGGGALDRARDAGADEVLKKPLSAREVATSLARVLRF